MAPLRWGIASAGKISHDFTNALSTWPKESHLMVAVSARKLDDAKKFAKLHGIEKYYEGYEALAKDPNVDVVYIGAINTTHYELGLLMLNNGKHVLCEKPLCMNEGQSKRLLAHAAEKKLFFMEAIWSRFFPAYIHLKNRIDAGDMGEIKEVDVEFGFELSDVDRLRLKSLGGGTVLDLGVYTIQVSLWALRAEPSKVIAKGQLNEEGVDMEVEAVLHFPNGAVAKIKTSALKPLRNTAIIRGTKGSITLHDFWSSTALTDIDGSRKEFPLPKARHGFNFINSCGLRYEAEETRQCINAGKLESLSVPHSESLRIARIQDEIRKQIGVRFPEDEQFKS
ncbi:trans-1,2-dihydrobenzene-1,2-diol dehydrogenase-like [Topomyia yanbarensis]|uniref:trans-1,2-dihydrobenzene-1,2-diol dehydrogenase-like n=1 Tax=Topomyia yanbarensis TaxID=2498891 RepID=UPI00273B6924|nr:trans-1,2-dihydrobenzene-1,2-diol dehydrogenase-like [Topomyia yanbarensis]XP_058818874.1 trans-1,2-dihydrobenzene-1,2-diol dehydrogenase-like [Topomyia yanbarensis]